jgi:hypothetical protein
MPSATRRRAVSWQAAVQRGGHILRMIVRDYPLLQLRIGRPKCIPCCKLAVSHAYFFGDYY